MAPLLPRQFVDLYNASISPGRESNVMGRVSDVMAPSRTRGTDWMFTFSIADHSMGEEWNAGLKVRFFRKSEGDLPPIQNVGDIVLLRNLKITDYQGMHMGMSGFNTRWTVFPLSKIPANVPQSEPAYLKFLKDPKAISPSEEEMRYAFELCKRVSDQSPSMTSSAVESFTSGQQGSSSAWTSVSPTSSSRPVITKSTPRRDKFSLIEDIKADTFYDLTGQVVKSYPGNGVVELYLSDYTSNQLLYDYLWGEDGGDDNNSTDNNDLSFSRTSYYDKKWPGPYGKYTLTVTLWPPHSYFAQNSVQENDIVCLRNIHIRWSKGNKLEGVIHTDKIYPDRVGISVIGDSEKETNEKVKNLLKRKLEYKRSFEKAAKCAKATARGQKRKAAGEGRSLAKSTARKRRKQENLAANAQKVNDPSESADSQSDETSGQGVKKKTKTKERKAQAARAPRDLNPNVKASHNSIPTLSLSTIFNRDKTHLVSPPSGEEYLLPFMNVKTRATVRVADYFPGDLSAFSVPASKKSEFDILSDIEDGVEDGDDSQSNDSRCRRHNGLEKWEWRFGLILEGASPHKGEKERLTAYVAGEDADFLLKLDAVDLKADPQALDELREKLFLLWGDLEEQKVVAYEANRRSKGRANDNLNDQHKVTPHGRPFECCLMEYGVKERRGGEGSDAAAADALSNEKPLQNIGTDWTRRWRLFGTTIT